MSPPTPTGATSAASPWACHGPRPRTGAALPGLRDRAGREVLRAVRTRQHRPRSRRRHPQAGAPAGASSPASMTWRAVVRADPDWFAVVRGQNGAVAATLEFPRYAPERRYVLSGDRMTIGRRSRTRGTAPDIDLAELDPAVSAAHALLVARSEGWDLVDLGSSNGTTLAVEDGPIRPHTPSRSPTAPSSGSGRGPRSPSRPPRPSLPPIRRAVSRGSGRAGAAGPGRERHPATAGCSRRGCRRRASAPARR